MENFTHILKILEGCLLGDGHLELHKNSKNACFSYGSSSKQHTIFIHNFFINFCSDNYQKIKRIETFDNRTNKTYVRYVFKTKCNNFFTEQQKRFYFNKKKMVPLDLTIDNKLLLMWYIGDGELEKKYGYIKLHTNSFTFDEVQFLCNLLKEFNANVSEKEKQQYIISIPRNKVKNFLCYIGECPIEDYKHKWKQVPYKNKNIEENGINFYEKLYPLIENDFKINNYTIYKLSKKYNVPIKCIKNYFDKNKIDWKPINNKKTIIQYDLQHNFIKEWESGLKIKNELNYSASAISECCRNKRKKYKNFIWKFKN